MPDIKAPILLGRINGPWRVALRWVNILLVGASLFFYFNYWRPGKHDPVTPWLESRGLTTRLSGPAILEKTPQSCLMQGVELVRAEMDEVAEQSGLEISEHYENTAYIINDSGNDPILFIAGKDGVIRERVVYSAVEPEDPEALALGPCDGATCLYIADMGDNFRSRSVRTIYFKKESALRDPSINFSSFQFNYPDGLKIDAESLMADPRTGDLYVITKHYEIGFVFRIPYKDIKDGGQVEAQYIRPLPFPDITGADFHPNGRRLFLVFAEGLLDISLDLNHKGVGEVPLVEGRNYRVINAPIFPMQESIAWDPGNGDILYASEEFPVLGPSSRIGRVKCL